METVAKKAASTKALAGAKAPAQKMTKTALIRYMAEEMEVPPKQVAGFFNLLLETATTQTRTLGEFTIPGLGKLVKHSVRRGSGATQLRAKRSRSRPRRLSSSGSRIRALFPLMRLVGTDEKFDHLALMAADSYQRLTGLRGVQSDSGEERFFRC